jgi:hypothetical protein
MPPAPSSGPDVYVKYSTGYDTVLVDVVEAVVESRNSGLGSATRIKQRPMSKPNH